MISERIDTWKEQLLQPGMLEGKIKGQAQSLRRFGVLPPAVVAPSLVAVFARMTACTGNL